MKKEFIEAIAETANNTAGSLIYSNCRLIAKDLEEMLQRDGGMISLPVKIELRLCLDENDVITIDPKIEWEMKVKRQDKRAGVLVDTSGMEQMNLIEDE